MKSSCWTVMLPDFEKVISSDLISLCGKLFPAIAIFLRAFCLAVAIGRINSPQWLHVFYHRCHPWLWGASCPPPSPNTVVLATWHFMVVSEWTELVVMSDRNLWQYSHMILWISCHRNSGLMLWYIHCRKKLNNFWTKLAACCPGQANRSVSTWWTITSTCSLHWSSSSYLPMRSAKRWASVQAVSVASAQILRTSVQTTPISPKPLSLQCGESYALAGLINRLSLITWSCFLCVDMVGSVIMWQNIDVRLVQWPHSFHCTVCLGVNAA